MCVKILTMIRNASSLFFNKAQDEINAIEGVPGQPNVRLYQLAAPAAGGARPWLLARARHTNTIVAVLRSRAAGARAALMVCDACMRCAAGARAAVPRVRHAREVGADGRGT